MDCRNILPLKSSRSFPSNEISLSNSVLSNESEIEELQVGKICYMDEETIRSLELVRNNLEPNNRSHSLLGVLDKTKTSCGAKFLRKNILRPPATLDTIEFRLNCVDFLVQRPDALYYLQNALSKFGSTDINQIVKELHQSASTSASRVTTKTVEKRLGIVTTLRRLLDCIFYLQEAMSKTDLPKLDVFVEAINDPNYSAMCEFIDDIIKKEHYEESKCKKREMIFAIKNGKELLLDLSRKTYTEALLDMENYVEHLCSEVRLPLKLAYQSGRGWYLYLKKENADSNFRMPKKFLRVYKTRNLWTFTTSDLMSSNVRVNMSYENCLRMSDEMLESLVYRVCEYSCSLYKIVDVVGFIDMISSFAMISYASRGKLTRPMFNERGIEIVAGRHIVLENVLGKNNDKIVANDTNLISHNFALITGPNMGGKTVYLKQVALIQIMAQMGCFVPAEKANLLIQEKIIFRSSSDDQYEPNCSSFMNEMKGVSSALKLDNANCLILMDEMCRGTSYEDASSFSFAIAEDLALRANVLSLFATHYPSLHHLGRIYDNVEVCQFKMKEEQSGLLFSHELHQGITEDLHYGIKLAEFSSLPKEVLDIAKDYLDYTMV